MFLLFHVFITISVTNAFHKFLNLSRLLEMNTDGKSSYHNWLLSNKYQRPTCTDVKDLTSIMWIRDGFLALNRWSPNQKLYETLQNTGHEAETGRLACLDATYTPNNTSCFLESSGVCDGFSDCLNDECGCEGGEGTFRCGDGRGCVTTKQVCDSRVDCEDASDECLCARFQDCVSDFDGSEMCSFRKKDCSFVESSQYKMLQDLNEITENGSIYHNSSKLVTALTENPEFEFHLSKIVTRAEHDEMALNVRIPVYKCTNSTFLEMEQLGSSEHYSYFHMSQIICNGENNCLNHIDEQHCPGYFYCKSNQEPIPKELVCDRVPHCGDSSDECEECPGDGLSSKENLIDSNVLRVFIMLQIILIISFNGYACHFQYNRPLLTIKGRIDRIQCSTLIFYDMLMAVFLMIIAWHQYLYSGRFCAEETAWRSSVLCQVSGFLYFFSSYGSLQVVLSTSTCRLIGIMNTFLEECKLMKLFVLFYIPLNLINVIVSILPILFIFIETSFTDMFLYEHFFKNNPIIAKGNKADLSFLLATYENRSVSTLQDNRTTAQIILELSRMFDNSSIFDPENVKSIGYYGKSALCVPDLFSNYEESSSFRWLLISVLMLSITVIGITYLFMLKIIKRSQEDIGQADGRSPEFIFFLSAKIYIMVGAQMFSWLPTVSVMVYSLLGGRVAGSFDEVLIAIITPVYSVLNPCLHTDLIKRAVGFLRVRHWYGVWFEGAGRVGGTVEMRERNNIVVQNDAKCDSLNL